MTAVRLSIFFLNIFILFSLGVPFGTPFFLTFPETGALKRLPPLTG